MNITRGRTVRIETTTGYCLTRTSEMPGVVDLSIRESEIRLPVHDGEARELISAYLTAISEDVGYRTVEAVVPPVIMVRPGDEMFDALKALVHAVTIAEAGDSPSDFHEVLDRARAILDKERTARSEEGRWHALRGGHGPRGQ